MHLLKYILINSLAGCLLSCTLPTTDTYDRFYFHQDGADLAVEVNGQIRSGTFILLLHGGPGGGSYGYNSGLYSELLEEDYALVYLDQRGQGASQGAYPAEEITLQRFADDTYNLVRLLKARYGVDSNVFLMGHSWGGTTGTYTLLNTRIEEEISGWIEVDGAHDIPMINKEAIKMFLSIGAEEVTAGRETETWQEIIDFASAVDTNNITVEDGGAINNYGYTAESLLSQIETSDAPTEYSHSLLTRPVFSLNTVFANLATSSAIEAETEATSLSSQLSEITIPTLFLWGKYDFVVPPALGVSAVNLFGSTDKELVIFEFSGHSPMDSEPELFAETIRQFVETHR